MPTTNHRDTTLTTDSRRVVRHFKKRHDNVLQAFDRLECGEEFSRLNFQVAEFNGLNFQPVEHRENPSVGAPIARVHTPAVGVPKFWVPIRNAGLSHQPLAEVTHPIGGSHHGCWQKIASSPLRGWFAQATNEGFTNRHTTETTAWK